MSRCPQPQTLGLQIGLDLREGLGADQVAEVDANLAIGLAHRLELRVDVPHCDPGEGDGILAPPGIPAVVGWAVVEQPRNCRHLPAR